MSEHLTYSVDEVAALLKVNRNTLYQMIRRGAFPCCRFGRKVRVSKAQLDAFLGQGVAA
jgi:excisionase family DNA binding protein